MPMDAGIPPGRGPFRRGLPDGGVIHYTVTDLGDLGGGAAEAYAINAVGQVVGRSVNDAGVYHAFLWDRTSGMRDLGRLGALVTNGSEARAINGAGEVVGVAFNGGNTAFYWLPGATAEMTWIPRPRLRNRSQRHRPDCRLSPELRLHCIRPGARRRHH